VPRAQECLSEGAGSEEPSQAVQTRTQESTEWAIQCWSLRKLILEHAFLVCMKVHASCSQQSCSDVPDARGSLLRCEGEIDQTFFERKAGEGLYELTAQLTWQIQPINFSQQLLLTFSNRVAQPAVRH